jgi:hypothetical protein
MLQISVYYLYVRKTYEISNTLGSLEKLMIAGGQFGKYLHDKVTSYFSKY